MITQHTPSSLRYLVPNARSMTARFLYSPAIALLFLVCLPFSQTLNAASYADVNGDGIPDKIVHPGEQGFTLTIDYWDSLCYDYTWYPINSFWTTLDFFWPQFGAYSDYSFLATEPFWDYGYSSYAWCSTWAEGKLSFDVQAGERYALFEDTTGSSDIYTSNLTQLFQFTPYTSDVDWWTGLQDMAYWGAVKYILAQQGKPAIETQTVATTPEDRSRKLLGVCEEVQLSISPSTATPVSWSITSGPGSISGTTGATITFTAHDEPSTSTITATVGSGGTAVSASVTFNVIKPTGVSMSKISSQSYPSGQAGAGMTLQIIVLPSTVSFYNIEFREIDGPASNISGYFLPPNYTASQLFHDASDFWGDVAFDNVSSAQDSAATPILPPPWADGSFVWQIPYKYRKDGSSGAGHDFATIDQEFQIWANGTVEVRKAGASVTRSP